MGRVTARRHLTSAQEFACAAIDLINLGATRRALAHVFPIHFLLAHALELALKAHLLNQGETADTTKSLGHDLGSLWNRAYLLGLASYYRRSAKRDEIVKGVDRLHQLHGDRYPEIGSTKLVQPKVLARFVAELVDSLDGVITPTRAANRRKHLSHLL
jgi:hypothetical protein